MSDLLPFPCGVPGCTNRTAKDPHVCLKHFIEGWGRLPSMPLPEPTPPVPTTPPVVEERTLYVSDKPPKAKKARRK